MAVGQPSGVPGISSVMGVQDPVAQRLLSALKQSVEHIVGHAHNQKDIPLVDPKTVTLEQLAEAFNRVMKERLTG